MNPPQPNLEPGLAQQSPDPLEGLEHDTINTIKLHGGGASWLIRDLGFMLGMEGVVIKFAL